MAFKRKTVSVTVKRMVQVVRFHPSEISVTEVADVPEGVKASEVKRELYESASLSVQKFMREEINKYKEPKAADMGRDE